MLDKKKVKIMTRLALYEETQGKEDFRISEYYRKDYAGIHALFSFLWVTVGYILLLILVFMTCMDSLLKNISLPLLIVIGGIVLIGYIFLVALYVVITHHIYSEKHRAARKRVKQYNHNLLRLLKLYEKEKK
jgi:hypothetical protein